MSESSLATKCTFGMSVLYFIQIFSFPSGGATIMDLKSNRYRKWIQWPLISQKWYMCCLGWIFQLIPSPSPSIVDAVVLKFRTNQCRNRIWELWKSRNWYPYHTSSHFCSSLFFRLDQTGIKNEFSDLLNLKSDIFRLGWILQFWALPPPRRKWQDFRILAKLMS